MIGREILHFRVLAPLGRGGMGEVWLAEDARLGRQVALKALPAAVASDPGRKARFHREARALAALAHPGIVAVHAIEEVEGETWLVMEHVVGHTLEQEIRAGGMPWPRFHALAGELAEAVAAAHEAGVVHRDLKPSNAMVTAEGRIKVLDFGLAKLAGPKAPPAEETSLTAAEMVLGTPPYLAPEQIRGGEVDPRADVHALGVLLFEMASGSRPFSGGSSMDLIASVLREPAARLGTRRRDAPPELDGLLDACLAKDPGSRPRDAREVATRLRSLASAARERRKAPPAAPDTARDPTLDRPLLRGRALWSRRTEEGFHGALAEFQHAAELEPTDPRPWIGMADCFNMLGNYGFAATEEVLPRALAAAQRALALDPSSADAARALALARWQFEFDWQGAETLYRRTLESNGSDSLTHYWFGILLGVTRRFEESLEHLTRAERLDPLALSAPAAQAWVHLFAGRPDEAARRLRRVLTLDPNLFLAHWFLGQALCALGDAPAGAESLRQAIALAGRTPRLLAYLGFAQARAEDHAAAHALLAELRAIARESYVPAYFEALVLAGMRERDQALAALERAWRGRDSMLRDLVVDPSFGELRSNPRFVALVRRLGLDGALG